MATMQVFGERELVRRLESLPDKFQKRALRRGVTKGMRLVAKLAKAKAPRETGTLKRSIGIRNYTSRNKTAVGAVAGPRRGFKTAITQTNRKKKTRLTAKRASRGEQAIEMRDPVNYAHLIEFGTRHHAAHPFLRPAFDASVGQVTAILRREVANEVRRANNA